MLGLRTRARNRTSRPRSPPRLANDNETRLHNHCAEPRRRHASRPRRRPCNTSLSTRRDPHESAATTTTTRRRRAPPLLARRAGRARERRVRAARRLRRRRRQRLVAAERRREHAGRVLRRQPVGRRHVFAADPDRLRRRALHDESGPGMDAGRRRLLRRHAHPGVRRRLRRAAAGGGRPGLRAGRLARHAAAGHRPRGRERRERRLRAGDDRARRDAGAAIPAAARQLQRESDRARQRRRERHLLSGAGRAGSGQYARRAARRRAADRPRRAAARGRRPADRRGGRDARVRIERAGHRRHAARGVDGPAGRAHAVVDDLQQHARRGAEGAERRSREGRADRRIHVAGRHRRELPGQRLLGGEHGHRVQPAIDDRRRDEGGGREPDRVRLVAVLLAADVHGRERGPDVHVRRHGPPDDAPARALRAIRRAADRENGRRQVTPARDGRRASRGPARSRRETAAGLK
ncbi:hypothetical protein BURPS1710b_1007 [Burkholderia pseudomallei 1710b]|uniref:Uncharacterized protein n=1 Tax=Burkholderia pseudomallei (strain 1710b) TaxID=320372 RepID=Q3JVI6_BURP1|nr:hypothetical protein BURPS1710b_1007 [Burkholderia pseudomallei 1710b]